MSVMRKHVNLSRMWAKALLHRSCSSKKQLEQIGVVLSLQK